MNFLDDYSKFWFVPQCHSGKGQGYFVGVPGRYAYIKAWTSLTGFSDPHSTSSTFHLSLVPTVVVDHASEGPKLSKETSVVAAHVHPESLLPTKLLPNTCNRARHTTQRYRA